MPRHVSRVIPECLDASPVVSWWPTRRTAAAVVMSRSLAFHLAVALAAAAALAALPREAAAANVSWTGGSNANWSRKQNWSTNTVPSAVDDAFLAATFSSGTSLALDGSFSVRSLTLTTATTSSITASAGGDALTLVSGSLTRLTTAGGTQTLAARLVLGANAVWGVDGGGRLIVERPIDDGVATFGLTKSGTGTLVLGGTSTYGGPTSITGGVLLVNGAVGGGASVGGGLLGGYGRITGTVSGAGRISPGDVAAGSQPGILTAAALTPEGGTDFAFRFTAATVDYAATAASRNDVFRLTGSAAFSAALGTGNVVDLFLDVPTVAIGQSFQGGFFTDGGLDLRAAINAATYRWWVRGNGQGQAATHDGMGYYALDAAFVPGFTGVTVRSATVPTAAFASGTVAGGTIAEFVIVPEPTTAVPLALGCGLVAVIHAAVRLRRRAAATGSERR